jgi:hypothetical protein
LLINVTFPLQETLRFHPIVYHIWREAIDDDILPLQNPIVTESGETLDELPIPKGQTIACSINGYNRYVLVHWLIRRINLKLLRLIALLHTLADVKRSLGKMLIHSTLTDG